MPATTPNLGLPLADELCEDYLYGDGWPKGIDTAFNLIDAWVGGAVSPSYGTANKFMATPDGSSGATSLRKIVPGDLAGLTLDGGTY